MTTNPDATRPDTASGAGLSEARARVLSAVRSFQDGATQKQIADRANSTPSAVREHLLGLEARGLITRRGPGGNTAYVYRFAASHTDAAAGQPEPPTQTDRHNQCLEALRTAQATMASEGVGLKIVDDALIAHGCQLVDHAIARRMAAGEGTEAASHWGLQHTRDKIGAQAETAPAGGGELREIGANLDHLDTLLSYARWSISDESPGHHPTMPSAVGQAAGALDALYNLTGAPSRRLRSAGYPLRAPTPDAPAKPSCVSSTSFGDAQADLRLTDDAQAPVKPGQGGEGAKAVAWRVKDFADGWILKHTALEAMAEADGADNLVQPLYTATPPADAALRSALEASDCLLREALEWTAQEKATLRETELGAIRIQRTVNHLALAPLNKGAKGPQGARNLVASIRAAIAPSAPPSPADGAPEVEG